MCQFKPSRKLRSAIAQTGPKRGIEQPLAGAEDCPPTAGALQLGPEPPSVMGEVGDEIRQLADEVPVADEAPAH